MPVLFRKPVLQSMSQGSRLAFVRQFRGMTQHQLGISVGMSDERVRNRICRYEKGGRTPKLDRIEKFAEVLHVNIGVIKVYDFVDPMDVIYEFFWLEELIPDFVLNVDKSIKAENVTAEYFTKIYPLWNKMRNKYKNREISDVEYLEWKFTYQFSNATCGQLDHK